MLPKLISRLLGRRADIAFGYIHIGKTGGTAFKAALRQPGVRVDEKRLTTYPHKVTFDRMIKRNSAEQVLFFIREPVSRYVSAFNSRLRKGLPRHFTDWSDGEARAFARFKTPNQLAEALDCEDGEMRRAADDAMQSILHCRRGLQHFLISPAFLTKHRARIAFIGAQEHFDADFERVKKILGLPDDLVAPVDDIAIHKAPDQQERFISELGRANLQKHYAADYEIYAWCQDFRRRQGIEE
jgi:hypothetical protein